MVNILANDLGVGVEQVEWLPDTFDGVHLRMVVRGQERRVDFTKQQIEGMSHDLTLEVVLVKLIRALGSKG